MNFVSAQCFDVEKIKEAIQEITLIRKKLENNEGYSLMAARTNGDVKIREASKNYQMERRSARNAALAAERRRKEVTLDDGQMLPDYDSVTVCAICRFDFFY